MKNARIFGATAVAAFALASLTGCFNLPGTTPTTVPGTDPGTDPGTEQPQEGGTEVAGTTWSGTDSAGNTMTFTLNQDGSLDIADWNGGGPYDDPADTWSVNGGNIELYVSNIEEIGGITYSGPAATGSMNLTGAADLGGSTYTLTLTQG